MEIQLIRNRLVDELNNLPDVTTPEIQSYALTTAVLVRRITEALKINDLRIQDAGHQWASRNLVHVLDKFVHYKDFMRALVSQPEVEPLRDDYIYLRSRRTRPAWTISLNSYFAHVRRFASDDEFVIRYLLRRIDSLLSQVVLHPEIDIDHHLLSETVDRMYDSLTLLGRLARCRTRMIPHHRFIDGYLATHEGSYVVPSPVVESVPYGKMLAEFEDGTEAVSYAQWNLVRGKAEKYGTCGSESYMVIVFRRTSDAVDPEFVFFKFSDLLAMFKELREDFESN